jgi:hypothetical protein
MENHEEPKINLEKRKSVCRHSSEPEFVNNFLRSLDIDSKESIQPAYVGLSYQPARLHRLAESIPWNRFLGSLNVYKYGL